MLDCNKFVAQLFRLPLESCFQPFLPLRVSGRPDCFVVFDLVLNHGVKDDGDFRFRCELEDAGLIG